MEIVQQRLCLLISTQRNCCKKAAQQEIRGRSVDKGGFRWGINLGMLMFEPIKICHIKY